jgi:hypothetical protein
MLDMMMQSSLLAEGVAFRLLSEALQLRMLSTRMRSS